MKLSDKMIKAGWVIQRETGGSFMVYGSGAQCFRYDSAGACWSEDSALIESLVERDLQENLSPFLTSSRLTALDHTRHISQPVVYLCRNGMLADKSVLHLGTGLDRFAEGEMLKAGCRSVADYDPNFFPDRSVLDGQYDVVMAHYVLNILPPQERAQCYRSISDNLLPGGHAYMTVQGVWPVEHKYDIIGRRDDGYLIRSGYNRTFRKGYDEDGFLGEIRSQLGEGCRVLTTFYSNTLAQWIKPGTA